MPDYDADIAEQYEQQWDAEHGAIAIDSGGATLSADTIRARLAQTDQDRIDRLLAQMRDRPAD